MSVKNQNRMANSVDPDETAYYEPSHQELYCLIRLISRTENVTLRKGLTLLSAYLFCPLEALGIRCQALFKVKNIFKIVINYIYSK